MWYQWPAYLALTCVAAAGMWIARIGQALNEEHERVLDREEREARRSEAARRAPASL